MLSLKKLFLSGCLLFALRAQAQDSCLELQNSKAILGQATELNALSSQISQEILGEEGRILLNVGIRDNKYSLALTLSAEGSIAAVTLAPSSARPALEIKGPSDNLVYLSQDQTNYFKITTDEFSQHSGHLIVTTLTDTQAEVSFSESVYKITIKGKKYKVTPRELISDELDFSNEKSVNTKKDKRPFLLRLQNVAANIVWGGGKEKTYKEILKAGNAAIKDDPELIGRYLKSEDVERIAKRMVYEDNIFIEKNAMSAKPKLMGQAYLYFSEALLKNAILEQMPMKEELLTPIVSKVMENFKACIANAKYSGGVEECKKKFAKTAVIKIAKELMFQQLDLNLQGVISGPNAPKDLEAIKQQAESEYNRCVNKHFTLPYEEAEKVKKQKGAKYPDAMKVAIPCLYGSLEYAFEGTIDGELQKTYKSMGIAKDGDKLLLTQLKNNNANCYQKMGISIDELGRRYDIEKMSTLSVSDFKNNLIHCVNNVIKGGGRVAVERVMEAEPSLQGIFADNKWTQDQQKQFISKLLEEGYDRCASESERLTQGNEVFSPTSCTDYITLKAKEAALSSVLEKEFAPLNLVPNPWQSEIAPKLHECTAKFFSTYMSRMNKGDKPQEKELTSSCFVGAVAETAYYIGGPMVKDQVLNNPSLKSYNLSLSDEQIKRYQGILKTCMKRELSNLEKIDELTNVDPTTKKTGLDKATDRCTMDVVGSLLPDIVPSILKAEFASVVKDEKGETKAKLQGELEKLIDPIIKDDLTPLLSETKSMDELTTKLLPEFKLRATKKAAAVLIDHKLAPFATGSSSSQSMAKIRDTAVSDLEVALKKSDGALTPQIMSDLTNETMALVAGNLIPELFSTKRNTLIDSLGSALGDSKENRELLKSLKSYLDDAVKFDPSITKDALDLQKKFLADIEKQRRDGKAVTLDVNALLKKYWSHPLVKKFVLSQLAKEIKNSFMASLDGMEKDELKVINLKKIDEIQKVKTKYQKLRELITMTTSVDSMMKLFSSKQGLATLEVVKKRMILPMLEGKKTKPEDMAAITKEVAKTFTESRVDGSFAERFAALNIQPSLDVYKSSFQGKVMPILGYKRKNLDWEILRQKNNGKIALNYFVDKILYPSMISERFDMKERQEALTSLIKKGLKE